jgi:hypothetical protein
MSKPKREGIPSNEAISLIEYCQEGSRVYPNKWGDFWELLYSILEQRNDEDIQDENSPYDLLGYDQSKEVERPPPSLILGGSGASNRQKRKRLQEQIEWADRHGAINRVDKFLRDISADDWCFCTNSKWDWSYNDHAFDDVEVNPLKNVLQKPQPNSSIETTENDDKG